MIIRNAVKAVMIVAPLLFVAGVGCSSEDEHDRSGGSNAWDGSVTPTPTGSSDPGNCWLMLPGATGDEPDGEIPVCCMPTEAQKQDIDEAFSALNAYRVQQGAEPYEYDLALEAAIQGHCLHMVEHSFFDHQAPESAVSGFWERAELCDTSASGENLAGGTRSLTGEEVIDYWKTSPGHNQNMVSTRFERVGIGTCGNYWGMIVD